MQLGLEVSEKLVFKMQLMESVPGSIYGATELLTMKSLTKENYIKEKRVPDWVNLKDNIELN